MFAMLAAAPQILGVDVSKLNDLLKNGQPDISKLNDLLKNGQAGFAIAILVVGAGLFTIALLKKSLSETFANVLRFFGWLMVVVFLAVFAGDRIDKYTEFTLKLHPPDQRVRSTIVIMPLSKANYKDYGPIPIHYLELSGAPHDLESDEPRQLEIHDGVQIFIYLDSLITKLTSSQNLVNLLQAKVAAPQQASATNAVKAPISDSPQ